MTSVRWFARDALRTVLRRRALRDDGGDASRSTLVFAPHPDDETLGCGGLIARRRKAGAEVHVAIVCDGSSSHDLPASELVALRSGEAYQATGALGVPRDHVTLLGFPDGRLSLHRKRVRARVLDLLRTVRPQDVLVPTGRDAIADHRATHDIVLAALGEAAHPCTVWEYPVWYWTHWPWIGLGPRHEWRAVLLETLRAGFGARLVRDFRTVISVEPVLAQKRAALDAYRTQMTRRDGDPTWPILSDVARGDFLDCFLQSYEIFRCYPMPRAA